jgi:hypothetical protein
VGRRSSENGGEKCDQVVLDDYSRCLLHGRFSFRGELPALELVFRRSLQKFGKPRRVYFDNGAVYHSGHVKHIVATLGVHRIIFTERGRPQGHGKIEALNRLIRAAFIAELKTSQVRTLDELNEAFVAWADHDYNRVVHGETGEEPWARWKSGVGQIQYADEENLRQAFLWREQRTADKAGIFSLFGTKYQVGPELARRRFELRYDPEMLDLIEVWHQGKLCERVRPFQVQSTRRPKISLPNPLAPPAFPQPPVADYLGHLVSERRAQGCIVPSPHDLAEAARAASLAAEQAVVDILHDVLDPAVVDELAIRDHCQRFGPFSPAGCEEAIAPLLERGLTDQHISVYLEAIVRLHRQGDRP